MIDLKKAEMEFEKYTSNYDKNNVKIAFKIKHSYDVEKTSLELSKQLKLEDEDILLAGLIGLLHDIGRFEQMKRYNTYVDRESVDHADLSMDILTENNFIRKFVEENTYDNIILKAVKNHNKYKIEEGLNARELLHAKIIRDTDKIDIMKLVVNMPFYDLYGKEDISDQILSEDIYNEIMAKKLINRKNIKSDVDAWVTMLAFVFDFNYKESIKWVGENGYIDKILKRIEYKDELTKQKMNDINNLISNYIRENI